jgi:cob(I)alamin adenosyltransferase
MPTFYTKTGDDGYTGLLGEGRVAKEDPRLEAVGTLDEATAALGLSRASCRDSRSAPLLLQVQRDLYGLMAEVAATPENASRFRSITAQKVAWLEQQTDLLSSQVELPKEFILPGDSPASAALALARTIVRRAERRVAQLVHVGELENAHLLRYLNRLSSLCFALELVEIQAAGNIKPTLAKEQD